MKSITAIVMLIFFSVGTLKANAVIGAGVAAGVGAACTMAPAQCAAVPQRLSAAAQLSVALLQDLTVIARNANASPTLVRHIEWLRRTYERGSTSLTQAEMTQRVNRIMADSSALMERLKGQLKDPRFWDILEGTTYGSMILIRSKEIADAAGKTVGGQHGVRALVDLSGKFKTVLLENLPVTEKAISAYRTITGGAQ